MFFTFQKYIKTEFQNNTLGNICVVLCLSYDFLVHTFVFLILTTSVWLSLNRYYNYLYFPKEESKIQMSEVKFTWAKYIAQDHMISVSWISCSRTWHLTSYLVLVCQNFKRPYPVLDREHYWNMYVDVENGIPFGHITRIRTVLTCILAAM